MKTSAIVRRPKETPCPSCTCTCATQPAPVQPVEYPTNEELEELWYGSHLGHPADFAADVLERWGGAPPGLLGYRSPRKGIRMTTPWAHLPNAKHIDWVLDSVRTSPNTWGAAWDADWDATCGRDAARGAARDAARGAAWDAARGAAWDAAYAAWDAARRADWDATCGRGAALDIARGAGWAAAWDACMSLVAWDDSSDVLIMPVDAVRMLASCGDHRAILLMPACLAREGLLNLKEST